MSASVRKLIVAASLLGVAPSADALVFCRNDEGALFALAVCGPGLKQITVRQITGSQGPRGLQGIPGPNGPAGPAGPAVPSVTASFAAGGLVVGDSSMEDGIFLKAVEKPLTAGSYVIFATASAVTAASTVVGGNYEIPMVSDCQLRNQAGDILGAGRATGGFSEFTRDAHEITVTGGIFIPEGTTNTVSLWCRSEFDKVRVGGGSVLMVLKIGGFTQ